MVELLPSTGSVWGWVPQRPGEWPDDWPTDGKDYDYGTVGISGNVSLRVMKISDGTLMVHVNGPYGEVFKFENKLPPDATRAVMVAVTWNKTSATLYINGDPEQTKNL